MRTLRTKYFYGNEISQYGQEHNRLDYATLSKAFDHVLCNDITKLFYSTINGEYTEAEQINGYIDNTEAIEELESRIAELEEAGENLEKIEDLQEEAEQLQYEMDYPPECYQYYIIPSYGADILQEFTDDPVWYIETLDVYVWGVTHWGTSWDYVLTDVTIESEGD